MLRKIFEGASIWHIILFAYYFVLGHCLFLKAHSFPQGMLSENCLLLGTDNVRKSRAFFPPNGDYCLYVHGLS